MSSIWQDARYALRGLRREPGFALGRSSQWRSASAVMGVWIAFAASRSLATVLYGVDRHDLATFVGVPVVVAIVAAVASVVPARRAARVDPVIVLRSG